jgi:pyruvate, water dikinase
MSSLFDYLSSLFSSKPRLTPAQLQAAFRSHYKEFRALLTANNNALELMAEMEQVVSAGRSFGMSFIRGHCTALSVNIFKMVQHLNKLSDGKYGGLDETFRDVAMKLEQVIANRPVTTEGALILPLAEIDVSMVDQVGEKMANLGEVRNRIGLRVPEGFVITAVASLSFIKANDLQVEINRRLKGLDLDNLEELYTVSAGIQGLIASAPLPEKLEELILSHHHQLVTDPDSCELLVALRSSAIGEDSSNVSFAGQYRTQLNVSRELVGQAYKEIVAGKYKSQAIVYRQQRGFRDQDVHMCVGCLRMVDAVVSGVMYTRDPDDPRSNFVLIQAAPGLASNVVDGSAATEQFKVRRTSPYGILESGFGANHGESLEASSPSTLTVMQAAEVAEVGVRLEVHFGVPQDVEWSIDRAGLLYILQSRPLGDSKKEAVAPRRDSSTTDDLPVPILAGGVCASTGVAYGQVFKVRSTLDLLRFPVGAVLVVETPYPDWASLLDRAVAVVSETGQVAAHLATVAREFGIPAIFGLKQAMTVLENTSHITVDATAGKVYSDEVEALMMLAPPKPNLMVGSPVHKTLVAALEYITPLNLTDPASPFFRPDACQTLHDITRFCHEKAMVQMFTFGERYGFNDKAAKQLVVNAPSQWWVIDLDNGFTPGFDPESRYVQLDHIASVPMLAIWEGMMAFPWEGPPPVNLRGFGAIIFQSTRNTNIDPAVRSALTAKNYFLVSKNFCNLSVRLGYHFAMVEAYLSELRTESYVSFNFKGGAADDRRKIARIQLLEEILSHFGFRVERKGDSMTARVEKRSVEYLSERLKILGYLTVHTRQIDMVMDNPDSVCHYKEKFSTEINALLGTHKMA